jgi:hypothetical protein
MLQKKYPTLWKCYKLFVWILMSIVIALIVIQIPVHQQQEEQKIRNEKIFESYGEILQSTYW